MYGLFYLMEAGKGVIARDCSIHRKRKKTVGQWEIPVPLAGIHAACVTVGVAPCQTWAAKASSRATETTMVGKEAPIMTLMTPQRCRGRFTPKLIMVGGGKAVDTEHGLLKQRPTVLKYGGRLGRLRGRGCQSHRPTCSTGTI